MVGGGRHPKHSYSDMLALTPPFILEMVNITITYKASTSNIETRFSDVLQACQISILEFKLLHNLNVNEANKVILPYEKKEKKLYNLLELSCANFHLGTELSQLDTHVEQNLDMLVFYVICVRAFVTLKSNFYV